MNNRITFFFFVFVFISNNSIAGSNYTNITTPATDSIIGIDSFGDDFSVGVGNGGQIIHINSGIPSLVTSGVSTDLFSVKVVDKNFAVTSGENHVLLWDGMVWNDIVDHSANVNPSFITPVWAPEEKNIIYYQILDTSGSFNPFHILCPYKVSDPLNSGFCKANSRAILEFCGSAGDIKALQTSGSILRMTQGTLSNLDDPLDAPVFDQPLISELNLIAAYIPENACIGGNFPPNEIFAIHKPFGGGDNEFYHFDGNAWSSQGTAGADQTLTGMDGTSNTDVYAVGREPDTNNGGLPNTIGAAWHYDGLTWVDDPLPSGTLGLTDVTLATSGQETFFLNSYEVPTASTELIEISGNFPDSVEVYATAECPVGTTCKNPSLSYQDLRTVPNTTPFADLTIKKELNSPARPQDGIYNIEVGNILVYTVSVHNNGPQTVPQPIVKDIFINSLLSYFAGSSGCNETITVQGGRTKITFLLEPLQSGTSRQCNPRFEVLLIPFSNLGVIGIVNSVEVSGSINDPYFSNNVASCIISSAVINQPAVNVECDQPPGIWSLLD